MHRHSVTTLPGFQDTVHDAQQTFRNLLEALSHPGSSYRLPSAITPPAGLAPPCAAACLTLFDLDTLVWLQPGLSSSVEDWLRFHTGCRFTKDSSSADFAIVTTFSLEIALNSFSWGSAEYPEQSTTLLIQVEALIGGEAKTLSGPGILDEVSFSPTLPGAFWSQWQQNSVAYPLGLDCFLFTQDSVVGLPRTTHIHA